MGKCKKSYRKKNVGVTLCQQNRLDFVRRYEETKIVSKMQGKLSKQSALLAYIQINSVQEMRHTIKIVSNSLNFKSAYKKWKTGKRWIISSYKNITENYLTL